MVDPGSFIEAGPLVGAAEYDANGNLVGFTPGAYVHGVAEIGGRPVAIGGDDFTISGGSPHDVHKMPRDFLHPFAIQYGVPCIRLVEGVGHSSKADEASGHMGLPQGDLWWQMVELLRTVPVASGIMGSVAGWPAALALLSHFTVMVKGKSQIFPSGPPVVRRAIGETLDKEALGGAQMHVHDSGQVDNEADTEEEAFEQIKRFLSYLPNTTNEVAQRVPSDDLPNRRPEELLNIIPTNRRRGYDARRLIELVVDDGSFFEMRRHWAGAIITGFARLDGYSVGILASDPMKLAGAMDGNGADKYTHFVDLCDAFNLPVRDLPGHARVHAGLGRRTEGHHAAGHPGADRLGGGAGAQGRVLRAQVLRGGGRCAEQPGVTERGEPSLRVAGGGVGRDPDRGRGGRCVSA